MNNFHFAAIGIVLGLVLAFWRVYKKYPGWFKREVDDD